MVNNFPVVGSEVSRKRKDNEVNRQLIPVRFWSGKEEILRKVFTYLQRPLAERVVLV